MKPKKPHNQKGISNGKDNLKKRVEAKRQAAETQQPHTDMTGMELETPYFDFDKKGRVGAKGLYTDEILPKVERLASQGLNNKDIAIALCIGNKTFYEWLHRYPQFAHSLSKYRGVADIMVENALFKTAVGYNYVEQSPTPQGKVVEVQKHMPGNAAAQKFYLKNRMKHRYQDKVETEISGALSVGEMQFVIKRRDSE